MVAARLTGQGSLNTAKPFAEGGSDAKEASTTAVAAEVEPPGRALLLPLPPPLPLPPTRGEEAAGATSPLEAAPTAAAVMDVAATASESVTPLEEAKYSS